MRKIFGFIVVVGVVAGFVYKDTLSRMAMRVLPQEIIPPIVRPAVRDIREIRTRMAPILTAQMEAAGLQFGAPVFIRIFKEENVLEFWIQNGEQFDLFRTYPICNYSGELGPKLREGDRQSPEGIYKAGEHSLNPHSSYHLSFNLGFPNAYDRSQGRTGSYLMIHGDCLSIGCYAMTDPAIEEIYVMLEAALITDQS